MGLADEWNCKWTYLPSMHSRTALAKRKSGGETTFPIPPTFDMDFHWYIRRIYIRIKQSGRKARACGGVSRHTRPARDLVILVLNGAIYASHAIDLQHQPATREFHV